MADQVQRLLSQVIVEDASTATLRTITKGWDDLNVAQAAAELQAQTTNAEWALEIGTLEQMVKAVSEDAINVGYLTSAQRAQYEQSVLSVKAMQDEVVALNAVASAQERLAQAEISAALEQQRQTILFETELDQLTRLAAVLGEDALGAEKLTSAEIAEREASEMLRQELAADEAAYEGLAAAMERQLMIGEQMTVVGAGMAGSYLDQATKRGLLTTAEIEWANAAGVNIERYAQIKIEQAALDAEMNAGVQSAENLAGAYGHVRVGAVSMGEGLGAAQIGILAVGFGFIQAAKSADDWQQTLNQLKNNTAASTQEVQTLGTEMLQISKATGASSEDLAVGARRILDYGFSAHEAGVMLTDAAQAAVSTGAQTQDVAQALAQAMHQYGAGASEAATYLDVLMVESQRANSTLGDFSTNIKLVTGLAANIGVPFDQATSAVAALTREMGSDAVAQRQVVDIMRFILAPTQAEKGAWDELSKTGNDLNISSKNLATTFGREGLTGVLDRVKAATGDVTQAQVDMAKQSFELINSQRGGIGLFTLLTGAAEDYAGGIQRADQIQEGTLHPHMDAFNATLDTAANKWDRLGQSIHAATAEGTIFANISGEIATNLSGMIDATQKDINFQWAKDLGSDLGRAVAAIQAGDWQKFTSDLGKNSDQLRQEDADLAMATEALGKFSNATDTGGERAVAAAQAMEGTWSPAMEHAKSATELFAENVRTELDSLGKTAPNTMSEVGKAMNEAWNGKLQQDVTDTKGQMDAILQEIDIQTQAGQEATAAGETDKANWIAQLVASLKATESAMQGHLDVLNAFSGAAAKAGAAAGDNWANNYEQAIAHGLSSMQPGFAPQAPGMPQMVPGGQYTLPTNIGPAAMALPSTMELNALAAQAEAIDKNAAAKGRSADAAAREASADARQQQTAQNALTTAQQRYELETELLSLTEASKDATNAYTVAKNALTKADKDYADQAEHVATAERDLARAERDDAALNAAKATVTSDESARTTMQRDAAAAANDLTVRVHGVTDALYAMDQTVVQVGRDLADSLAQDEAALKTLQAQTAAQDLAYTHMKEHIEELQYQEAQQQTQVMGPYVAAYDAATAAVTALQQKSTDLTNHYANELFPIEKQLTALENERNAIQRQDTLQGEAQTAANLTAQLKNLVPGSAEYNSVLKQQQEAQKNLGIDVQIDQLTKQKQAIEARRDAALQAVKLEIEAAQAKQKAAKDEMDAEQKIFDQQKKNLDQQAANIAHEQKLYDEQQRDKTVAAQAAVTNDQDQINSLNTLQTRREQADKDYLAQLQHDQSEQQYTAGQASYWWGTVVDAANDAVKKLEEPYTTEHTRLQNLATDVRDEKQAFDDVNQPIVDALDAQAKAAKDVLDVFKTNKAEVENASKWADAQAKFAIAVAAVADKGPGAGSAVQDMAKGALDAANNTATLNTNLGDSSTGTIGALNQTATAITQGVKPAVQDLSTTTGTALAGVSQTFNKYFGEPSSPGYDPSVSISWLMNMHNPDGFYAHLVTWADIALGVDGMRGMMDNRFDDMKTDLTARATDLGNSIMGGIGNGATTDTAVKGLSDAITAAVEKAMKDAETNLGIHSPSTLAAQRIGLPVGMGVAMGIDQSQSLVATSMRNLIPGVGMGAGAMGPHGDVTNVDMSDMHIHLHFPNVSKPPEDPNAYSNAAADAMLYAMQRRLKKRGQGASIFT